MAVAHYLEALDFQKEIVKIQTIFGGRNPHPNWLVGGVPSPINLNDTGAVGAVNMERLNMVSRIIDRTIEFIDNVYIPDLLAIASFYKEWASIGGGLSSKYLMSYGDLPRSANDYSPGNLMMPRGAIIDGNLNEVHDIDLGKLDEIQEFVTHSWYKYGDEQAGLHPFQGETVPNFDIGNAKGTRTKIEAVDEGSKYSWVKAPRWNGHAMEVGPLARYVIGYVKGIPEFKEPVDMVLQKLGGLPVTALFSTLGRTAARGLECSWAAHALKAEFNKLVANIKAGDVATANMANFEPSTWKQSAQGYGFVEAPRGALCHWIDIEDRRSRTTSAWCRRPGTRARVTRPARSAPTRRRCSTRRCTIRTSRSRSCARSTASTHAWPVQRTCSTWRATKSRASRCAEEGRHQRKISPFDAARGARAGRPLRRGDHAACRSAAWARVCVHRGHPHLALGDCAVHRRAGNHRVLHRLAATDDER